MLTGEYQAERDHKVTFSESFPVEIFLRKTMNSYLFMFFCPKCFGVNKILLPRRLARGCPHSYFSWRGRSAPETSAAQADKSENETLGGLRDGKQVM